MVSMGFYAFLDFDGTGLKSPDTFWACDDEEKRCLPYEDKILGGWPS